MRGNKFPCPGWVVITGAGRGFGRALALEFAGLGCDVLATDQDAQTAAATASLAEERYAGMFRSMRCDVTRLEDWQSVAASLAGEKVGTLVNNAGVACGGLVGEIPIEDWRWSMDINFMGTLHGCHVFVPIMRKHGRGHIVNISSAGGFLNLPGAAPYSAAKAAVISLSETLRVELHASGLRVSTVCPTFIRTDVIKEGRFSDEQTRSNGQRLIRQGRSIEGTAKETIRLLELGKDHVVPFQEGRFFRNVKQRFPRLYAGILKRAWPLYTKRGSLR